jgi:predicted nucleic acid-binding protein
VIAALLDSNILIDSLLGHELASNEIKRYERPAISLMSWMEVMSGTKEENRSPTRQYLASFRLLGVDSPVAERAVLIRARFRLKLPDAIIWATAQEHRLLLVTRNTKDFPTDEPGFRMPYRI